MMEKKEVKGASEFARLNDKNSSMLEKYKDTFTGDTSLFYLLKFEILTFFLSGMPGAPGFFLRKLLYRSLFKKCGRGVVFGRNMTVRHPKKIEIGDNVVFDDNSVIDAKGKDNKGLKIGSDCMFGRNTIISCKNGDIEIGNNVNIGPNNYIVSESILKIGDYNFIAGQSYIIAGGNHSFERTDIPICEQPSYSKGGIILEEDVWIAASVTVVDGAIIRKGSVIGAGSVVHRKIPAYSVALGNPVEIIKKRK